MTERALPAESLPLPQKSARGTVLAILREHRVLFSMVLAYICIGGVVLTLLRRPWPIQFFNTWFAGAWALFSAMYLLCQLARGRRYLRAALTPQRIGGAACVAVLMLPTQITFQALKQSIGPVAGFPADPWLHRIDTAVHGGMPWRWLRVVLEHESWIRSLDRLYMAWFILLVAFATWACWSGARVLRQRALVALLLLWVGGGTIGAWITASAGPAYYHTLVAGSDPYAPLMERLDELDAQSQLYARFNERGLWQLSESDQWAAFGGISAMPSMHVGFAVLVALVAWSRSRALGAVMIAYAAAIQLGSIVLAWHYAIDGYVGAVLAGAAWRVAGRIGTST